jgi:type IV pilus assembly protein PilV
MKSMRINSRIRADRKQRGFSLVEVLIALIIMSVGMLGIAGLYVQSMQAGRTSLFRHHAVTLAGDVADRIRANPRAGVAYAGLGADNNCVAAGIDCDPAQMASNDIFHWDQQATESLPNGNITVAFDNAVVPPSYTIAVGWDEPGEQLNYTIVIPVMEL